MEWASGIVRMYFRGFKPEILSPVTRLSQLLGDSETGYVNEYKWKH